MDNPEPESVSSESLEQMMKNALVQMEQDEAKSLRAEESRREGYMPTPKKLSSQQIIERSLKAMKNMPKEGAVKKLVEKLNSNSDYDYLKQLTNNGRNVEARNENGTTALMIATGRKDYELMKLLLDAGAFVDATDNEGKTALIRAHGDVVSVEILLNAGADVNASDNYDQTPLMAAMQDLNAYYGVRELIRAGADVKARDKSGNTALMMAANSSFQHESDIVRLLLDAGADVNAKDSRGETALMRAVSAATGRLFIPSDKIEVLIRAGADLNAQNKYGQTALMFASQRRNERVVKLLLDNGANRSLVDYRGHTANDYAQEKDYKQLEVERLLKS